MTPEENALETVLPLHVIAHVILVFVRPGFLVLDPEHFEEASAEPTLGPAVFAANGPESSELGIVSDLCCLVLRQLHDANVSFHLGASLAGWVDFALAIGRLFVALFAGHDRGRTKRPENQTTGKVTHPPAEPGALLV